MERFWGWGGTKYRGRLFSIFMTSNRWVKLPCVMEFVLSNSEHDEDVFEVPQAAKKISVFRDFFQ